MAIESFNDMILPDRISSVLSQLTDKTISSMLFSGTQGLGKTLTCSILEKQLGMPTLIPDLSLKDNRGVASVASIADFIERKSSKKKLIILNEADNLSNDALKLLKNLTDEYDSGTNDRAVFLLTTNNPEKIPAPVRGSRCIHINFNPKDDEKTDIYKKSYKYCMNRLVNANVNIDDSVKTDLKLMLANNLPDIRAVTKNLDMAINAFVNTGKLFINFTNTTSSLYAVEKIMEFFNAGDVPAFVTWYHANIPSNHKQILDMFSRRIVKIGDANMIQMLFYHYSNYVHKIDTGRTPDVHVLGFFCDFIGDSKDVQK